MKRREFLGGVVASAILPESAEAQRSQTVARVAVLWHAASAEQEGPYFLAVRDGFRDLGYVEGQNFSQENRFPNEEPERFQSMAAELVSQRPDVLLAAGESAAIAAKNATTIIPIVFTTVPDPIASKLVDNLARPSGNVTGLSNFSVQLCAKRLEYLKQSISGLSRVALLVNPNVAITARYIDESRTAAEQLGLDLQLFEARSLNDFEGAFDAMVKSGSQAVAVHADGLFYQGRAIMAKLALDRRLPTCVYSRETLESGALMSYGPDQPFIFRRATAYADKIIKGAKPSDLPVELPAKFEFLINLKTAKFLGFNVPPTVLALANDVVE